MHRSSAPSHIAIDASALVELLLQTPVGKRVASLTLGAQLVAPDVINPETMQSLRRLERVGSLTAERAAIAVVRLRRSPIVRVPTGRLIEDAWSLRANVSAYDACYLALARAGGWPLLTTDAPLRRALSPGVTFMTVS
ncbi:MAG TPA: type II toxin-antitoxin system VapC family toxin [Solirubrobacteraceae bacterium]|nr:type II toxin-antitoxin system VapC family toxin [Solirubrobacteraceae bacterium]